MGELVHLGIGQMGENNLLGRSTYRQSGNMAALVQSGGAVYRWTVFHISKGEYACHSPCCDPFHDSLNVGVQHMP
jgi:hypothetical protein